MMKKLSSSDTQIFRDYYIYKKSWEAYQSHPPKDPGERQVAIQNLMWPLGKHREVEIDEAACQRFLEDNRLEVMERLDKKIEREWKYTPQETYEFEAVLKYPAHPHTDEKVHISYNPNRRELETHSNFD